MSGLWRKLKLAFPRRSNLQKKLPPDLLYLLSFLHRRKTQGQPLPLPLSSKVNVFRRWITLTTACKNILWTTRIWNTGIHVNMLLESDTLWMDPKKMNLEKKFPNYFCYGLDVSPKPHVLIGRTLGGSWIMGMWGWIRVYDTEIKDLWY